MDMDRTLVYLLTGFVLLTNGRLFVLFVFESRVETGGVKGRNVTVAVFVRVGLAFGNNKKKKRKQLHHYTEYYGSF